MRGRNGCGQKWVAASRWLSKKRSSSKPSGESNRRCSVRGRRLSDDGANDERYEAESREVKVEVEEEGEMGCGIAIEIAVFCLCCSGGAAQALSEGAAGHAQLGFLRE